MLKRFLNIRLSYIYPSFFVIYYAALTQLDPIKLSPGQLALYSVNSFLFGFYFGPILNNQKTRVVDLGKTVRKEEMAILDMLAQSHLLEPEDRHALKIRLSAYLDSIIDNPDVVADNIYYDELLRFTKQKKYKDNSVMDSIYHRVSATQENRDTMESLYNNKLFSHEWIVVAVLFFVTIFFALQTDYAGSLFFRIMLAVLCTGISLMVVILAKYATLTHKQAKHIWDPLHRLRHDHFEDVDQAEVSKLVAKVRAQQ